MIVLVSTPAPAGLVACQCTATGEVRLLSVDEVRALGAAGAWRDVDVREGRA